MSPLLLALLTFTLGTLGKECKRFEPVFFGGEEGGESSDDDCPTPSGSPTKSSISLSSTHLSSSSSSAITSSSTSNHSMNSTSTTLPFDPSHNPTQDPSLNAPLPPHHPFDTATLIALVLGIVVVLLLMVILLMLLRRRRRKRANIQRETTVEQGGSTLLIESKGGDKKHLTPPISPPASTVGTNESRTSSCVSRIRRVVRGIITSNSTLEHDGANNSPNMSEARQGVLVSLASDSQMTATSRSPSLLADLTSSSSSMRESSSVGPISVGGNITIAHPINSIIHEDGEITSIFEMGQERRPPPTYASIMVMDSGRE